jgi:hypothetical protein
MFFLQDKFYFLPYALDGTIDVYGRYNSVTPLPFNGSVGGKDKEDPWIQGLSFNPIYEVIDVEDYLDASKEELINKLEKSCVILRDYSEQMSQINISR